MTIYSYIVIFFTCIGMAIWLFYMVKKRKWLLAIGPLTYFTSILLFYAVRLTGIQQTPSEINMWSNMIRLESIFLFSILGITLLKRGPVKWI